MMGRPISKSENEIALEPLLKAHGHAGLIIGERRRLDAAISAAAGELATLEAQAASALKSVGEVEAAAHLDGRPAPVAPHDALAKAVTAVQVGRSKLAALERARDAHAPKIPAARLALEEALDTWWGAEARAFASKCNTEIQELAQYLKITLPRVESRDVRRDQFPSSREYEEAIHALKAYESDNAVRQRIEELNAQASVECKALRGKLLRVERTFTDNWGHAHNRGDHVVAGRDVDLKSCQALLGVMTGYTLTIPADTR